MALVLVLHCSSASVIVIGNTTVAVIVGVITCVVVVGRCGDEKSGENENKGEKVVHDSEL